MHRGIFNNLPRALLYKNMVFKFSELGINDDEMIKSPLRSFLELSNCASIYGLLKKNSDEREKNFLV